MARWQSKAQLEEQANEAAKRQVVSAVKDQVAQLVAGWEVSGYPGFSECEKAIGAIVRNDVIFLALQKDTQYYVRAMAPEHFMKNGIDKAIRDKQLQEEKAKREAFKLASASRVVVEEGMFSSSMTPGEINIVTSRNAPDRCLTCLTCEFIRAPRDVGQDDDGYYCTLAEPTEEEKATEAYQRAAKKVADDLAYVASLENRASLKRLAFREEVEAKGEEVDPLDEFWAGLNE